MRIGISRFSCIVTIALTTIGPAAFAHAADAVHAAAPDAILQLVKDVQPAADPKSLPGKGEFTADDEKFLDDLEQRGIRFFIDEQDPTTGLMPDRAKAVGGGAEVASTASVGFGLTALCIGDSRGWVSHQEAYDRSMKVLRFLRDNGPQEHGHFYHFLDMKTGKRVWNCEVSNIDTALLMAGILTVRQHFPDTDLAKLANELYERVEWDWLLADDGQLRMGWRPENGFIDATWGGFSEHPLLYLIAMGSKTHPISVKSWDAWKREPIQTYSGLTYVNCPPLFTHQYPQCWFDLRGLRDDRMDFFRNSQLATIAQRQWFIDELSKRFSALGADMWGLTASDTAHGYEGWGGPPQQGEVDGSVVPAAAAGSLAFTPRICLDALRSMSAKYGEKAYLKYGFVDSFNPGTGWYNGDVLGIDVGPSVVMAENCRTGFVWKTFMSSPEAQSALKIARFRKIESTDLKSLTNSTFESASSESK